MKRLTAILFLFPTILFAQENIKFSKTITTEDLEKHLSILSSDSLEGRETGQKSPKNSS